MTNPKGTKLETAVVRYLRESGRPHARRIVKEGALDKGDVTLGDGIPVTIECKDRKGFDMAQTQRELKAEMENARTKWGFAIHKKRGTTNVGEYYAVLPVHLLMDILDVALVNDELMQLYDHRFVANVEQRRLESPAPAKRVRSIPRYDDP